MAGIDMFFENMWLCRIQVREPMGICRSDFIAKEKRMRPDMSNDKVISCGRLHCK